MTFYYKQHTDSVTTYKRCYRIDGANPYVGNPSLTFREETVTTASDGTVLVKLPCGDPLVAEMTNPDEVVQLTNPETGQPIPGATVKMQEIYLALYSLYFAKALARDQVSP